MKAEVEKPAPKPYQSPKLVVYGDIRGITQTVGLHKKKDGGTFPRSHSAV